MILRPYQARALAEVEAHIAAGRRRPLVVSPVGSGKGHQAAALLAEAAGRGERALLVVHRREIVLDIAKRTRDLLPQQVGVILPGHDAEPFAPIQVASVQTLLAREHRPPADLLVVDEAHHAPAPEQRGLIEAYPDARVVGFTATPERADGKPMGVASGGIFDALVVAAQYSELLAAKHLVPCRVFQPPEALGRDLAQEPLAAYRDLAAGTRAFCFVGGVAYAQNQRDLFAAAGIPVDIIHGKTPKGQRDETLRRFQAGDIRVLINIFCLTEGVNIPEAETIILARACDHASTFLQIVGRALRPSPGKDYALLLDLTGASLRHGLPTEDRHYSLDGRAIEHTGAPLCVCQKCGYTFAGVPPCPECGYAPPKEAPVPPRVWSLELREVYAGVDTPDPAKGREWARLRALAQSKQWSLGWAVREYRKLFTALPPVGRSEQEAIYRGDLAFAASKGWRDGWAKHRYRELFGVWPRFGARAA